MTTDTQALPEDAPTPLSFPPPTQNMRRHSCPSQDDFILKGRGLLLAFVGCAVFWVLVFLLIGGV